MSDNMPMKLHKIFLVITKSYTVLTFRKCLIKKLQDHGCEVGVIAFDDEHKGEIERLGVRFYSVHSDNRSLNPIGCLKYQKKVEQILLLEKPDSVFTFMLKPNIFGVFAAKKAKVKNIFSMIEGLGDVFINTSAKWRVIRVVVSGLYRMSLKIPKVVFFINKDDEFEFINRRLVKECKTELINGIGVDLEHFAQVSVPENRTALMVARMLKTKGVIEYCEAARLVKKRFPDAVFKYLGSEGTVSLVDIQPYIDDGSVDYLGVTNDVRPYLEQCSLFVLPSYREGVPMSVMEAEGVGRAIVTTDAIGCRDTVIDEYNGFLVNCKNSEQLAEKIIWLFENMDKLIEMGCNSRKFAEEHFDQKLINAQIVDVMGLI